MLTIGSTVYWITGGNELKRGEVMAINATSNDDGRLKQLCVCTDDVFHILNSNESWNRWFESIDDAVDYGLERIDKAAGRGIAESIALRKAAKDMKANPPTPNE